MGESSQREPVNVVILDREFTLACAPDERAALMAAVSYLDVKMRELKRNGNVAGFERLAVLAALTITHDLLADRHRDEREATELTRGLASLRARLDAALPASLQ